MHTDVISLVYDSMRRHSSPRLSSGAGSGDKAEKDNLVIEAWNEKLIFGLLIRCVQRGADMLHESDLKLSGPISSEICLMINLNL